MSDAEPMAPASGPEESEHLAWWVGPWEFAVHVFVGTLIFGVIALPAVGLDFAVTFLTHKGVSSGVLVILRVAEYGLLITDVVLLFIFLWRAFKRAIARL